MNDNSEFLERAEANRRKLVGKGFSQFKSQEEKVKDIAKEELEERIKLRRRVNFHTGSDKAKQIRAIHDNKKLTRWL